MTLLLLLFISYAIALSAALARAGYRSHAEPSSGAPHHQPSKVLIVGATGGTGRQLVTQALERGYAVTALVRDPSRLQVDHPQLTVIRGDVLDEGSVDAAMRGQEAVLSALGHKRYFYPTRILSEGTRNILRAMETHGVQRLVCETSLGIGDSLLTVRISRADVADFMLNQLASDTYLRTAPGVCSVGQAAAWRERRQENGA